MVQVGERVTLSYVQRLDPVTHWEHPVVGQVVGTTHVHGTQYLIVELDQGFWTTNDEMFVSLVVTHPANVRETDGQ